MIDFENMTLAQAKEYCKTARKEDHVFCGDFCKLYEMSVCNGISDGSVQNWELHAERLTPQELKICRAIGAKWISKDRSSGEIGVTTVDLWKKKPEGEKCGSMHVYRNHDGSQIAAISDSLFPSVKPGDCICVGDMMGKDANEPEAT